MCPAKRQKRQHPREEASSALGDPQPGENGDQKRFKWYFTNKHEVFTNKMSLNMRFSPTEVGNSLGKIEDLTKQNVDQTRRIEADVTEIRGKHCI